VTQGNYEKIFPMPEFKQQLTHFAFKQNAIRYCLHYFQDN